MIGGGVDYDSGPYTVTVPAGETSTSFNVSITNDDISERTENLNLIINASSIPDYVIVINPNQARVTIVDNDGKYMIELLLIAKNLVVRFCTEI